MTRRAVPDDAEGSCAILHQSIRLCCIEDHHNDASVLDAWLSNKTAQHVRAWFDSPALFSAVATADRTLSGVCSMTRQGRIVLFHVAPEARRAGVGDALLQAVMTQAIAWGICLLQVHSTASARRFFTHRGFHPVGKAKFPFGANAIVLSKRLCASYPPGFVCGCGMSFPAAPTNDAGQCHAQVTG